MELPQVHYFLTNCEHGSFSRAAEACDVTQPALTKAIKNLEDQIGGQVFHSEGRWLEADELDLVVANPVAGFGDPFRSQRLYGERYVAIFPPGHAFGRLDSVRLADLDGHDYVDRLACQMHETLTREYSVTVGGLMSRALTEPPLEREVHAFEVRGRARQPAANLFVREIRSSVVPCTRKKPGRSGVRPSGVARQCLRLRVAARPARPRPTRAMVAGSGTPARKPRISPPG